MLLIQILVLTLVGITIGWFVGRLIKTVPRRIPVRARNSFRSGMKH